jgi:hypothetical protein
MLMASRLFITLLLFGEKQWSDPGYITLQYIVPKAGMLRKNCDEFMHFIVRVRVSSLYNSQGATYNIQGATNLSRFPKYAFNF